MAYDSSYIFPLNSQLLNILFPNSVFTHNNSKEGSRTSVLQSQSSHSLLHSIKHGDSDDMSKHPSYSYDGRSPPPPLGRTLLFTDEEECYEQSILLEKNDGNNTSNK